MLKLFVLELTIYFFLKILTQVCDDKNNVSFVIENRQNKTRTHTHTHGVFYFSLGDSFEYRITSLLAPSSTPELWLGSASGHIVALESATYNTLLILHRFTGPVRCLLTTIAGIPFHWSNLKIALFTFNRIYQS